MFLLFFRGSVSLIAGVLGCSDGTGTGQEPDGYNAVTVRGWYKAGAMAGILRNTSSVLVDRELMSRA